MSAFGQSRVIAPKHCRSYGVTVAADACWSPRTEVPIVVLERKISSVSVRNMADHTVYIGGLQQACAAIVYPILSQEQFAFDINDVSQLKIRNPSIAAQGGTSGSGAYSAEIIIFFTYKEYGDMSL